MDVHKGIIYYTDNEIGEPIDSVVKTTIMVPDLPITSVSLKPLNFGENVVLYLNRGYPTMVKQIVTALQLSKAKYVFFCEHDVLYHPSHFEFTPLFDNIFYYNRNVWRWKFGSAHAVRYDRMLPLSCLCVNREFALSHYKSRDAAIEKMGPAVFRSREPALARKWGYEPGTKKMKRGGFSDDDFDTWESSKPNIDIRHGGTFSPPKVTLESFKHAPVNWEEIPIKDVPGWDLKRIFAL